MIFKAPGVGFPDNGRLSVRFRLECVTLALAGGGRFRRWVPTNNRHEQR